MQKIFQNLLRFFCKRRTVCIVEKNFCSVHFSEKILMYKYIFQLHIARKFIKRSYLKLNNVKSHVNYTVNSYNENYMASSILRGFLDPFKDKRVYSLKYIHT